MVLAAMYGAVSGPDHVSLPILLGGLAVGVLAASLAAVKVRGRRAMKDLPHPQGLPFIGNLFQVSQHIYIF